MSKPMIKCDLNAESKLKILICKKEALFCQLNALYGSCKNISNFDSRSNEKFMTDSEIIDEYRAKFECLVDDINELNLSLKSEDVPNYNDLFRFDELYLRVKRVRNKILSADSSFVSASDCLSPSKPNIKLPAIELPSFDGKTENWSIFYESFRTNIHENSSLSDSQRVQYLVGKLTHHAQKFLAGVVPTGDTYHVIWDSLVKKYQDRRALGTHYLKNIFNLKNCQNNANSLDGFIEKYSASILALKQLAIPDLADFILLHCALIKMDVQIIQAFEMSVGDKDIPSYNDLISFIQNQVKILERSHANDSSSLLNPRVNRYVNKGTTGPRAHTLVASHGYNYNASSSNEGSYCVLCNKMDHTLSECLQFKGMKSPKVRFEFIKSRQGCVNCLSISHSVTACTVPANCKICKTKFHHELLHFDNNNNNYNNKKFNGKSSMSHVQTSQSSSISQKPLTCAHGLCSTAACGLFPAVSDPSASALAAAASTTSATAVRPAARHVISIDNDNSARVVSDCAHFSNRPSSTVEIDPASLQARSLSLSANSVANANAILLATAQVYARGYSSNDMSLVRCLIDNGSQNHLVTLECCKKLNLHVIALNNSVVRGVGMSSRPIYGYVDFDIISRISPHDKYSLHALVVDCITDQLPSQFIENCDMSYLHNIPLADLSWNIPGNIDIVLGAQLFPYIYLGQKILSGSQAPPALLTSFGYVLMGDCPYTRRVATESCDPSFSAVALNDLNDELQKFWQLEEITGAKFLSPEETDCENLFTSSVTRDDFGRYTVALPFCVDAGNLGNSRSIALRRLLFLERKFRKVPGLREDYNSVINEYQDKNYLSRIPDADVSDEGYYIPHHAVVRQDKPKPRIVLDASAKTHSGVSLNDILHTGPNLQADLFLLLLNFRLFPVAMTADVQQMYLQVGVPEKDRKYLRMLFRFHDNDNIETFQFNRVPFGLKCSPFLAMRTLRQMAIDMAMDFPEAAEVTESKFYMDDLVHSVPDESTAVRLALDLISLFKAGCMDLVKWNSNSLILLKNLPDSHRSAICFDENNLNATSKVLGLSWDPSEDNFFMTTKVIHEKCTKRNILSVVARLFDVLGFVAPVVLYAKLLIKELWLAKIEWDQVPPVEIIQRFSALTQELPLLSNLKIPRHVGITLSTKVMLVGFCDASLNGYGCVLYLHVTDSAGGIAVSLLCAKSKVAPTKITTLARLELCAAVLMSKLMKTVLDSYRGRVQITDVYAFSDSTIALSWISSSPHRWSIFVANRVAQCQEYLSPYNFYHVSGSDNPSDCVSRGMLPSQLMSHKLWWSGPQWLQLPHAEWPVSKFMPSNVDVLPEHKAKVMVATVLVQSSVLYDLSLRISSWGKLLRITVFILRFIKKINNDSSHVQNLLIAEMAIVKVIQTIYFSDDLNSIRNNKLPTKKLHNLSVFIDTEGILRIGGRLSYSDLPFEVKHPVLLPKHDHVVNLIITHFHELYCHAGPGLLMSIIRQKFWILDARTVIRARVRRCNSCFRVNPSHPTPKMADLPSYRITEAKAFVHTGVDYAGPLRIILTRRRGQHAQKAYICLFVCLVTKAIHIELVTELSSDCFLSAFKRFISRRGPVSCMYSDNGTNFVGARAQLNEIYRLLLDSQHNALLRSELEQYRIDWKLIPPRAPHFGSLWESNIKSLKTHLYRVIGNQLLTYEELQTVLIQIESIMNSRPLSVISSDPHPEVLTPAHFLMSTPLKHLPASEFSDKGLHVVKRKQLLDNIVASYWKRWRSEYLHTLQVRQKWQNKDRPVGIGTVVLLEQDNVSPLSWPLGVITNTYPGADGIVRVVTVKTRHGLFKRPVVKLYPLPNQ